MLDTWRPEHLLQCGWPLHSLAEWLGFVQRKQQCRDDNIIFLSSRAIGAVQSGASWSVRSQKMQCCRRIVPLAAHFRVVVTGAAVLRGTSATMNISGRPALVSATLTAASALHDT